jgi:hypothetical protein
MRTNVLLTIFLSNLFSCVGANSEGGKGPRRLSTMYISLMKTLALSVAERREEKMLRTMPDWHELQTLMRDCQSIETGQVNLRKGRSQHLS